MAEPTKKPTVDAPKSDATKSNNEAPTAQDQAELYAKPNDQITMSNRDAGISHLTKNLVPQEGEYVSSDPSLVPPKYADEDVRVQDRTAPSDDRRSSLHPDDRRVGPGF